MTRLDGDTVAFDLAEDGNSLQSQNWNNFLVPLLYLPGGSFRPLTTGLYLFLGGRSIDIGPLAAGTLITIVPVIVLYIALQRQVSEGFLSGAVKG